jgi:glutathione S-transferase
VPIAGHGGERSRRAAHRCCRGTLQVRDCRIPALREAELEERSLLLGEAYSRADLVPANTVHYVGFLGVKPEPGLRTQQWLKQCMARPALPRRAATENRIAPELSPA